MTTTRAAIEQALAAVPAEGLWTVETNLYPIMVYSEDVRWEEVEDGEATGGTTPSFVANTGASLPKAQLIAAACPANLRQVFADHDAEKKALEDELVRVREALESIAQHGTHYDTMPTRKLPIGDAAMELDGWWARYFMDADTNVRRIARAALSPTTTKD